MSNKKIFEFDSIDTSFPPIEPAKNFIPDWYKNIKPVNNKNIKFNEQNNPKFNVKSCMPFFDTLTSGYIVSLWCDIHFESQPNGSHYLRWGLTSPEPVEFRNNSVNPIPTPIGCESSHYAWKIPYYFRAPKEYSLLITHPFNRYDLPFLTLTGIAQASQTLQTGNIPFFIQEGYSGVVEAGTPIAQIVPIKNDSWKIENNKDLKIIGDEMSKKSKRIFGGWYKSNIWTRKEYE